MLNHILRVAFLAITFLLVPSFQADGDPPRSLCASDGGDCVPELNTVCNKVGQPHFDHRWVQR